MCLESHRSQATSSPMAHSAGMDYLHLCARCRVHFPVGKLGIDDMFENRDRLTRLTSQMQTLQQTLSQRWQWHETIDSKTP